MAKESAEFSIGGEARGMTIEMGGDGEDIRHAPTDKVEFDTDDLPEAHDEEDSKAPEGEPEGDEAEATDGEEAGQEEAGAYLPDFDPEDPEVVSQYDSRFLTEAGELDAEGALSAEYFANVEKGIDGLNESTYEYLATKGISKATVKQIEAMAATARDAEKNSVASQDHKLFEIAGGAEELQKALAWGKDGGYSVEQQKRFNSITSGKDLEAKQEAVEALMARYRRANPPEKPKLPARDATKGQGKATSGVNPFASRQEMREMRSKLRDNDTRGWAAFNARLKVSNFKD